MAKARVWVGLAAGCWMGWHAAAPIQAAPPTVAQMLSFRPKMEGIVCSTPTTQEQDSCKVELVSGSKSGSNGWMLRDGRGHPLRRYFDSDGNKKVDLWSYYQDGAEVYREIDSNGNDKADQYRWLNAGGCKWGIDINEDGKIDSWKVISAEEASQEALQALASKDFARLQVLLVTEADLKSLELPAADAARIRQTVNAAQRKFQETLAKLPGLGSKTAWVRLETVPPQCLPADQTGMRQDLIKYDHGTILYENNGKHDFLQTGELIQVGTTWKLVDAPFVGNGGENHFIGDPELQKALDELRAHDAKAPQAGSDGPTIVRYNLQRADILQQIVNRDKPEQREMWVRQIAESLAAAAQNSSKTDRSGYERLAQLAQQVAKDSPGSNLAAFVAFRDMQTDYMSKLQEGDYAKLQTQWSERLAQFVQTYPKAEDAAEAIMQLGMVNEYMNKEIEAKNWYARMVKDFPNHPLTPKAIGSINRLELEGKEMKLVGPKRSGGSFDITSLRGKMVIVYYWASYNQQCIGDFARMQVLLNTYGPKGLELVCVNLDNGPPMADSAVKNPPGVQMFHQDGLDSPLAVSYGIHTLPHLFLVGKDGKVISRTIQVGSLEDELKKNLK